VSIIEGCFDMISQHVDGIDVNAGPGDGQGTLLATNIWQFSVF